MMREQRRARAAFSFPDHHHTPLHPPALTTRLLHPPNTHPPVYPLEASAPPALPCPALSFRCAVQAQAGGNSTKLDLLLSEKDTYLQLQVVIVNFVSACSELAHANATDTDVSSYRVSRVLHNSTHPSFHQHYSTTTLLVYYE